MKAIWFSYSLNGSDIYKSLVSCNLALPYF